MAVGLKATLYIASFRDYLCALVCGCVCVRELQLNIFIVSASKPAHRFKNAHIDQHMPDV